MKKKLPWINTIALFALSILIIILSLKFISTSKELKTTLEVLDNRTLKFNEITDKNDAYTYFENLLLDERIDSAIIIEDISGNARSFEDLKIRKPKLIFFIHQTHCSSCWGKTLEILVKEFPEIAKEDLIVCASYQNFRDIVVPLKELNLPSDVYNLVQGSFGDDLKKLQVPFVITTDSSLLIKNLLIFDVDFVSKFRSYVRAFEKKKQQHDLL